MWPVAIDITHSVVGVCLFVLSTWVIRAEMLKPVEMPFEGLTHVDSRNCVLDVMSRSPTGKDT